jgi:L-threonylcarbamoyladenylate synthase
MVQTKILRPSGEDVDPRIVVEAASALREGKLVVFPTETVYGLGCNSLIEKAVTRIFRVKGRPRGKQLAFYVTSKAEVVRYAVRISRVAEALMEQFWPGPLTVLLLGENGTKIGFRCPDDKMAQSLIRESGIPITATSANRSGGVPPVSGEEAIRTMEGFADVVIAGAYTRYRGESTVVDMSSSPPVVVREGVLSRATIKGVLTRNLRE